MAGIGFVLQKLVERDTLSGVLRGYLHGTLASSGPWLLTILSISCIYAMTRHEVVMQALSQFRTVILYNFCFALVLSSPITVLATRRLSDCIYKRDIRDATGMLIGTLFLLFGLFLPIASFLYFHIATIPLSLAIQGVVNFLLISAVWLAMVYVSALKYYMAITYSFIIGIVVSICLAAVLAIEYSATGMLFGFNIGLALILASIIALIFAEYPRETRGLFGVLEYAREYGAVALGALFYNLAAWVDKWVMWFSPEAQTFGTGLPNFPHYDGAMFLAYLTIIPAMAMFLVSQETQFFEAYLRFYRSIQEDASFVNIQANQQSLIRSLVYSGRSLLALQIFVSALTLLAAPKIFEVLDMNFVGLGIFRIGIIGVAFQVLILFVTIFLAYFDYRMGVLFINVFFFVANLVLSLASRSAGLPFYGYGYFAAAMLTFCVSAVVIERYVRELPYHAFIDNNSSIIK